jgi:hypothetical protein
MSLSWTFSYSGSSGKVTSSDKKWLFSYPCSSNSSCSYYRVTLTPGVYLFELWGAQGGDSRHTGYQTYQGAVGGYTSAAKSFTNDTELNLYIGGMGGLNNDISGGFNGGGKGDYPEHHNKGAGGGGATDVRIINGGSSTKILVAGGGGGSNTWQENNYGQVVSSGVGGGLEGGTGTVCLGGAQTSRVDNTCYSGISGYGGNGTGRGSSGGGGYFGGNGGKGWGHNGGGGSGFIDPSISTINGIVPVTLSGTNSFPVPSLTSSLNETGHEGNGAIRITYVGPSTRTPIPEHIRDLCKILNTYPGIYPSTYGNIALLSLALFVNIKT